MKTAGIDACEAGWLLVTFDKENEGFRMIRSETQLEAVADDYDRIFIHLPIGLSQDETPRECDRLLLEMLGSDMEGSFPLPPIRPILDAPTYVEANIMNFELTGTELPLKSWSMVPRIRTVDHLLGGSEGRRETFFESHPELLFQQLNGGQIYQNRQTRKGLKHRLDLVRSVYPGVVDLYRDIKEEFRRNEVEEEVIVDTLALASAARQSVAGDLMSLPEDAPDDHKGLKMAIYYVRRSEQ